MADIRIRWLLDVQDRGAGARVLKQDRALRSSLVATDAQYRKTGLAATSVSERQAQAAARSATATQQQGRATVVASEEVQRYAAVQREMLTLATRIVEESAAVEGAYKRQGRAARAAAAETSRASRVRSAVGRAGSAVVGAGAAAYGAVRNVLSTAGVGVGLAGAAGIGVAVKETIGFDRALRNVNSIAQVSEKRLQGVGKAILSLAGKTAQAPKTLAEGMYDLVSSGFNVKDSLTIVGSAARAATAGLSTTDVSTKALAAVLNAYHYSASKANEISDTLFTTVNYGVITFGELAEHIGTLLPFSASLGVSLKEDGAAISTLTKQGISGELSITFLKNAMVAFLKPSKGMADAIKKTGYASGEALIKAKGFEGGLNTVIGTTDKSKSSIAKLFPNIRSLTAALGLTGKNAASAAKDLHGFQHDSGATGLALSQQAQSVSYQWNKLKATFSATAIELGNKFVPAANEALKALTSLLNPKSGGGHAVRDIVAGFSAGISGPSRPKVKPAPARNIAPILAVPTAYGAPPNLPTHSLPTGAQGAPPILPVPVKSAVPLPAGAPPILAVQHGLPSVAKVVDLGKAAAKTETELSTLAKLGQTIGNVARTIGTAAATAGKELLEAFRPALPFFQNILLPLLEGVGKGVIGGVVVAFKIAIPVIKTIASVLGFLGEALKPLAPVFKILGVGLGVEVAGPLLLLAGRLPKVGLLFRLMAVPVRLASIAFGLFGKGLNRLPAALGGIGSLLTKTGGLFGKLPGRIGSAAGGMFTASGRLATAAGRGLKNLPAKLAVNAYSAGRAAKDSLVQGFAGVGERAAASIRGSFAAGGTKAALSAIGVSAGSLIGAGIIAAIGIYLIQHRQQLLAELKQIFGGGHPSTAQGVEQGGPAKQALNKITHGLESIFGGRRGGRIGRGGFRRYQAGGMVDALVSPGEQIIYGGQSMMVPGAPVAADSVYMPLPIGAAVLTGDGQARMSAGYSLGEALAMQAPHFGAGGVVQGRVSTFGPPSEAAGTTASGVSSSARGVAIRPGATWQSGKATLGQYWQITIGGHTAVLKQTDLGPNQSTGRRIDVTGAGARYMGIDPARFPTDSTGRAALLGKSGSKSGSSASRGIGRSSTRGGLVADALNQGVEAGAAGLTRAEIARNTRGARGAEPNPVITAIAEAFGTVKAKKWGKAASKQSGLSTPNATYNPSRKMIASWIVPYLSYGASHGWSGVVTSGYRSRQEQARIYASGVRPAARPGTSKHEGTAYPSGAVDVTLASILSGVLAKRKGAHLLRWAGAADPVHFSHPVNGKYRRGGIIGLRGGGIAGAVSRLVAGAGSKGAYESALRGVDALLSTATTDRLEALRQRFVVNARKGGSEAAVKSFQALISVVDFELGRRIGAYKYAITKRSADLEHGQSGLERSLRLQGIDASSVAGLTIQGAQDQQAERVRQQNVEAAKAALKIAKRTGNRQQIADAAEQLNQAQEDLEEAIAKRSEDARTLIVQRAQDTVDTAQFGVDSANNALSGLDISQRVNRTAETPAGLVQKAQAIQAQILPALQGQLAALNTQLGAYQSIGDTADARAALLGIQTAGNEIANAMGESADLIRQAAEQSAAETVERAGHVTSLAQLGEAHLELQQRIAGTFEAGGQQRAEYVDKTLIPALNNELVALQAQLNTAGQEGDQKLAEQIAEAIAGKQNDLLQATLDATEAVAKNTSEHKVGGTLGFGYSGENLSDTIIAVGSGA